MNFRTLDQAETAGKRVLVRVDLNVPMHNGRVADDTRLRALMPTIEELRKRGARVVLMSHFDRPKGRRVPAMGLRPLVAPLSELIGAPVAFAEDCIGRTALDAVGKLGDGDVLLLENLRFHPGEEDNDAAFAGELAKLGDLYVNDAFSAAHRSHASTEAIAHILPAYAGRALQSELEHLEQALGSPQHPVMGIIGGAKVSTKLDVLNNLIGKLEVLALGGAMANTFLFAQGYDLGATHCEETMAATARGILDKAKSAGCRILLPTDVVVAESLEPGAPFQVVELGGIRALDKVFDAGPNSLAHIVDAMRESKTLIWNGPLGVFEVPPFDGATRQVARTAATLAMSRRLVAVAGGGDTVAALNSAGVTAHFSYVSTAGGAFLEWLADRPLPGVAALQR
jgi:phosphoglycerate kinase